MQASEYIQFATTVVGLTLIARARISYAKRLCADASVTAYTMRECAIRYAASVCIGVAVALIFLPF